MTISGIQSDRYFDFQINNAGDIETNTGLDQIAQDLTFKLSRLLSQFTGIPRDRGEMADVEVIVEGVLQEDDLVISVDQVEVVKDPADSNEIDVRVTVQTDLGVVDKIVSSDSFNN